MRDFTIQTYIDLILILQKQGFEFLLFKDFKNNNISQKKIVLRHDVDARKENSLFFAKIQHNMGIVGTYYFRIVPQSFDEKLIKEIAALGHEVGYHYEDVGTKAQWHKGTKTEEEIVKNAIKSFAGNLEKLRKIVPVTTICMHGSPMSRWDSRLLWKYYDYHDFGIIGEPYFDIDFNDVLYLTDTGRRWDGDSVSIWDKPDLITNGMRDKGTKRLRNEETEGIRDDKRETLELKQTNSTPRTAHRTPSPSFHSTFDIIKAANEGLLPDMTMMTFHPQRWTDKPVPWLKELVMQNVKNVGKYFLVKRRTTIDTRHREKG